MKTFMIFFTDPREDNIWRIARLDAINEDKARELFYRYHPAIFVILHIQSDK